MLIYVTGTIGAGKGEVTDYLIKKYGMKHYSFRQFFTDELVRRGLPVDRPHMTDLADELREKNGPDYVVRELTRLAREAGGNAVLESIRNPGEVAFIKEQPDTLLIGVDAPVEVRYERNKVRGTALDNRTFEEFVADDKREMANTDPWRGNIAKCVEMADYRYMNVGTLDELHAWIDGVIEKIGL